MLEMKNLNQIKGSCLFCCKFSKYVISHKMFTNGVSKLRYRQMEFNPRKDHADKKRLGFNDKVTKILAPVFSKGKEIGI